jgi:hypothetical protein
VSAARKGDLTRTRRAHPTPAASRPGLRLWGLVHWERSGSCLGVGRARVVLPFLGSVLASNAYAWAGPSRRASMSSRRMLAWRCACSNCKRRCGDGSG